jgi:hypothetical protein
MITTPVSVPKIDTETDVKIEPPLNIYMTWNKWSEKSKDIPFKSASSGVGHGEHKVAGELEIQVLGQNSTYDMMLNLNGLMSKCDVKKLDKQDDFNTGKKGRDALRCIKTSITILLDSLSNFANSDIFTPDESKMILWFKDVSPDELAVGTLKKLKEVCKMLFLKKEILRSSIPLVPFTIYSQTSDMSLDLFYTNCEKLGLTFPSEFFSFIKTIKIIQLMDHPYINEPEELTNDLNSLVFKIFEDIKLIIVDSNKGYMLVDIRNIQFYRITRGYPRFKVIF